LLNRGHNLRTEQRDDNFTDRVGDGAARLLAEESGEHREHVATGCYPEGKPGYERSDQGDEGRRQSTGRRTRRGPSSDRIAGRNMPWDEHRNPVHDAVRQSDAGAKEGHFVQGRHDFLGLGEASPAVRAAADVLAERLYAESAVLVQQ
jgi:hypothetical protein